MAKIAVVQLRAPTKKEESLPVILDYIAQAAGKGADMCAFPEFMMFYTDSKQDPRDLAAEAEYISGGFVSAVRRAAGRHRIEVVGTLYEKSPRDDRVYDTAFILDKTGSLISTYRKLHLYDTTTFHESDKMTPGDTLPGPAPTAAGMAGMLICYDLRFPEMSRALAEAGSYVLIAPSAWVRGDRKIEHWITMNRARAIENGCFMVSPDHTGHIYCGRSLVVSPVGDILLDMGTDEGISYMDIDPHLVEQTRSSMPLLEHRRLDIYPSLWGSRESPIS